LLGAKCGGILIVTVFGKLDFEAFGKISDFDHNVISFKIRIIIRVINFTVVAKDIEIIIDTLLFDIKNDFGVDTGTFIGLSKFDGSAKTRHLDTISKIAIAHK